MRAGACGAVPVWAARCLEGSDQEMKGGCEPTAARGAGLEAEEEAGKSCPIIRLCHRHVSSLIVKPVCLGEKGMNLVGSRGNILNLSCARASETRRRWDRCRPARCPLAQVFASDKPEEDEVSAGRGKPLFIHIIRVKKAAPPAQ